VWPATTGGTPSFSQPWKVLSSSVRFSVKSSCRVSPEVTSTSVNVYVAWLSPLRIACTSARRSNWKVVGPAAPIVNVDERAVAVALNSSGARPSAGGL
jgi:hypothetical protein